MFMRRLVLALGVLALGTSGSALAADMPVKGPVYKAPPVVMYNWTGFYVGINGGYGWGRSNQIDTLGVPSGTFNQTGGLIGGTLGYNWQFNNVVVGLEGDLDWASVDGSIAGCFSGSCYTDMRGFGTVRPRVGMAWGMFMPFVTGGLAFADIRAGQTGPFAASNTSWKTGWTVGGGVEAMVAPQWSVKAEYLFADFGSGLSSYRITCTGCVPVSASERVSVLRLGVNYHF